MTLSSASAFRKYRSPLILVVLLAVLHGAHLVRPDSQLVNLVPDDACFYPRIAQNYLLGHGVTFDGVNVTTGFHPAWFIALVASIKATSIFLPSILQDGHLLFRVSILATCLVNMLLGLVTYRLLCGRDQKQAPLCMALVLLIAARLLGYGIMMETHLLILFLGLLLLAAEYFAYTAQSNRPRTGAAIALFATSALVPLARIDFAVVAVLIAVLIFAFSFHGDNKAAERNLSVWIICGSCAGIALNLLFNFCISGQLFSTSAYLKNYGPNLDLVSQLAINAQRARTWVGLLDYAALLILVVSACLGIQKGRGPGRQRLVRLTFFCAATFSLLFLHLLKNNLPAPWYYWPFRYFLFVGAFVGLLSVANRVPARRNNGPPYLTAGFSYLFALLVVLYTAQSLRSRFDGVRTDSGHTAVYEFSKDVAACVPKNSFAFCEDFSGFISLFSQRRIINGDGLVNSPEYISGYLTKGKVWDYLKVQKVPYYIVSRMDIGAFRQKCREPVFLDSVKPFFLDIPPSVIPLSNNKLLKCRPGARKDRAFAIFELDFGLAYPPEAMQLEGVVGECPISPDGKKRDGASDPTPDSI